MAENPSSVFISYSWNDDKPFVEKLDRDLRDAGIAVWRDEEDMPAVASVHTIIWVDALTSW